MAFLMWAKSQQFFDNSGNPLNGGKIRIYDAGTLSAKTVYQDTDETVPWSPPITLDSAGRPEQPVYIGSGPWKYTLETSAGVVFITEDNIPGDTVLTVDEYARPNMPVLSKSLSYTVLADDIGSMIQADATGGDVTITLISAVTAGDGAQIGVQNVGSANRVIVTVPGGQTVNGASSIQILKPRAGGVLTSNAGSWSGAMTDYPLTTLSKTTTYTVEATDSGRTIKADATGGGFSITTPAAATVGDDFRFTVVKTDSSTNLVTIEGNASETINGAANVTLSLQWHGAEVRSDGTNWQVTATTAEPPFQSATDNTLVRADGTRGKLQTTGIVVADTTNDVSAVGTITQTATGANTIPNGTTGQRPSAAAALVRYNNTLGTLEYSTASGWVPLQNGRMAAAWATFDGTGGTGAKTISEGFNAGSLSKTGTGDYTLTFSSVLASSTFAFSGGASGTARIVTPDSTTTGNVRFNVWDSTGALVDSSRISVIVFAN
jgi:hypothetical protein